MQGRNPEDHAYGSRIHLIGVATNAALAAVKLVGGFVSGSPSLLADGMHSLADTFITSGAWVSFRWAGKPADEDHHYGHGKAEAVAESFVGLVLLIGGVLLVYETSTASGPVYTMSLAVLALSMAMVSVGANEWLYRMSIGAARRLKSPSLHAVARDNRSDTLSSLLVIVGVTCSLSGLPKVEILAAAVIGLFIATMGFKSFKCGLDILMDRVPDPDLRGRLAEVAQDQAEVEAVQRLGIHPLGHQLRVDMEISVDGDLTVRKGHEIAHEVEEAVMRADDRVVEVAVHVNPAAGTTPRPPH